MTIEMTSNKPYLVRAFYDWISDNQLTPYIVVDVSVYGVIVPMAYVNDGQIVLNVSGAAVGSISLAGDTLEFSARFGGKLEHIIVPYAAIAAIYAKENGVGTALEVEQVEAPEQQEAAPEDTASPIGLASVSDTDGDKPKETKAKGKGKPGLKVVK